MSILDRFNEGCRFVGKKILWIILVPVILDLVNLFSWEKIYHTAYNPVRKIFIIKLGFIGAPPSVNYLLEDFPTPLFKYNNGEVSGIITGLSLFNVALFITIVLITSFLHSGYMSVISANLEEKGRLRDFFIKGNKRWHKFFLLDCITWLPITLMIFDKSFIYLSFINVIFVYVKYSFVVDEVSIRDNFKLGMAFLFNNLSLSVRLALSLGLTFSVISLVVFPLGSTGNIGIIIDIVICAFFGAGANRAVLEVYAAGGDTLDTQIKEHIEGEI